MLLQKVEHDLRRDLLPRSAHMQGPGARGEVPSFPVRLETETQHQRPSSSQCTHLFYFQVKFHKRFEEGFWDSAGS